MKSDNTVAGCQWLVNPKAKDEGTTCGWLYFLCRVPLKFVNPDLTESLEPSVHPSMIIRIMKGVKRLQSAAKTTSFPSYDGAGNCYPHSQTCKLCPLHQERRHAIWHRARLQISASPPLSFKSASTIFVICQCWPSRITSLCFLYFSVAQSLLHAMRGTAPLLKNMWESEYVVAMGGGSSQTTYQ